MSCEPPFCPTTLRFVAALARRRSARAGMRPQGREVQSAIEALEILAHDLEATAEQMLRSWSSEPPEELV